MPRASWPSVSFPLNPAALTGGGESEGWAGKAFIRSDSYFA